MDLHQLIKEWKEEKFYLASLIIAGISIILFVLNVPYKEVIVIGGFLIFSIVLLFRILR